LKIPFDFAGENDGVKQENYKELSEKITEILKTLHYHDYLEKILNWINQQ
jgi:hypothetical protein